MKLSTLLKHIAGDFDVKIKLYDKSPFKGAAGEADTVNRVISLVYNNKIDAEEEVISALFHELGHIYCYEMGIYKRYHKGYLPTKQYLRKYALKAELKVDKIGKKLMKIYFPEMQYRSVYMEKTEVAHQFLRNWYGF